MKNSLRRLAALLALVSFTLGWAEPAIAGGCGAMAQPAEQTSATMPHEAGSGGSHVLRETAPTPAMNVDLAGSADSCPMSMPPGGSCSTSLLPGTSLSTEPDLGRDGARTALRTDLQGSGAFTSHFRPPRR